MVSAAIRILRRGYKRLWEPHIRLDGHNLPDATQWLEMAGKIRTPACDPDTRASTCNGADEMAPEKSGAPVNGYQRSIVERYAHGKASFCCRSVSRM